MYFRITQDNQINYKHSKLLINHSALQSILVDRIRNNNWFRKNRFSEIQSIKQ